MTSDRSKFQRRRPRQARARLPRHRALIEMVERLGDLKRLLIDLLIPAEPALIPIRIDEHRRRR
jgi:hypothetical protein